VPRAVAEPTATIAVSLPRKAKGERPQYFPDPATDKLITMIMSLAGEVAVMHDRHDTLERILARQGIVDRDTIESFRPTQEELAERDAWREVFLGEVLRVLQQDMEMLAHETAEPYQAAVDIVSK
jgi:hypothetical protein